MGDTPLEIARQPPGLVHPQFMPQLDEESFVRIVENGLRPRSLYER